MTTIALVFVFFTLLAIAYELHTLTERTIEIGTIVEHANRSALRASRGESDDDYASESITKTHRKWTHVVGTIVMSTAVVTIVLVLFGAVTLR